MAKNTMSFIRTQKTVGSGISEKTEYGLVESETGNPLFFRDSEDALILAQTLSSQNPDCQFIVIGKSQAKMRVESKYQKRGIFEVEATSADVEFLTGVNSQAVEELA
jgi:hypothetical protein